MMTTQSEYLNEFGKSMPQSPKAASHTISQDQSDDSYKRNEILAVKPNGLLSNSKAGNDSIHLSISPLSLENTNALDQKDITTSSDQYVSNYSEIQETSVDVLRALMRDPPWYVTRRDSHRVSYANQIITNELESLVTEFLKKIIYYQSRQKKLNAVQVCLSQMND